MSQQQFGESVDLWVPSVPSAMVSVLSQGSSCSLKGVGLHSGVPCAQTALHLLCTCDLTKGKHMMQPQVRSSLLMQKTFRQVHDVRPGLSRSI